MVAVIATFDKLKLVIVTYTTLPCGLSPFDPSVFVYWNIVGAESISTSEIIPCPVPSPTGIPKPRDKSVDCAEDVEYSRTRQALLTAKVYNKNDFANRIVP